MAAQKTVRDHFSHIRELAHDRSLSTALKTIENAKHRYTACADNFDHNRLIYDAIWMLAEACKSPETMPCVYNIKLAFEDLCAEAMNECDEILQINREGEIHRKNMVNVVKRDVNSLPFTHKNIVHFDKKLGENIDRVKTEAVAYNLARDLATIASIFEFQKATQLEHQCHKRRIHEFDQWMQRKECADLLSAYGYVYKTFKAQERKMQKGFCASW